MFPHCASSNLRKGVWAAFAVLLLMTLALPTAAGDKKKKGAAAADQGIKRVNFDLSKIIWPNPPAITRIRFVLQFTGEKIDFNALNKQGKVKQKQSWMDRLAGTKPQADLHLKLPFQLIRTCGLAFDSGGSVYAADQGVGAIFIFNPEIREHVQLIRNGQDAHFGLINGLAIDDNDRIFVSDDKLHRVTVISPKHQEEGSFGADVLLRPGGLALDTENRFLYVVDTQNDVVVVFDADTFKVLRKIGVEGKKHTLTEPGTFSLPTNVAVDTDGNVYVTDTLNNRVEIFDADGKFISMFGKNGDSPGYLSRPKGIAVDIDGHIWVVDAVQQRVQVFDHDGRLLIYFGQPGQWPGQFSAPYDIAIDRKSNRVAVSEQFPGRVQMFRYVTDAEAEQIRIAGAKEEQKSTVGEAANAGTVRKDPAEPQ